MHDGSITIFRSNCMNCPLLKYNRGTGTFRKKTQNNPKSQNTRVVKGHRCTYPCVFTHTIYPIEGRVLRSEIGVIEFWVLFFITPGWKRKDRIFQRGHKGSRKLVSVTSRRYKMLQRSVIKPTFPIRSFHKKRTSYFCSVCTFVSMFQIVFFHSYNNRRG